MLLKSIEVNAVQRVKNRCGKFVSTKAQASKGCHGYLAVGVLFPVVQFLGDRACDPLSTRSYILRVASNLRLCVSVPEFHILSQ